MFVNQVEIKSYFIKKIVKTKKKANTKFNKNLTMINPVDPKQKMFKHVSPTL
jgi:hypothetical protein